jgi:hypothetical protein
LHSAVEQGDGAGEAALEGPPLKVRFASDSPLEEAGFELSVPHDTTKLSRPPHVASSLISGNEKIVGANPRRCRPWTPGAFRRDQQFESGFPANSRSLSSSARPGEVASPMMAGSYRARVSTPITRSRATGLTGRVPRQQHGQRG